LRTIFALLLYSRTRFIINLLPELSAAAPDFARVITVAAGTKEGGQLDPNDFDLNHVPLTKIRSIGASIVTISLQVLAQKAPNVTFIHGYPGSVKSSLDRTMTGLLTIVKYLFRIFRALTHISAKETGERHTFLATSARWPAKEGEGKKGVKLADEVGVAKGVDGDEGSGCYSVDEHGESAGPDVVKVLKHYGEDGTKDKLWKHIEDKFVEITGTVSI
jgi:hypothetical protein